MTDLRGAVPHFVTGVDSALSRPLLVLSDLWPPFPGGAERLIFNLSRDLLGRGVDVRVLTSYEAWQQFDGPPVEWRDIGVFDRHQIGAEQIEAYVLAWRPAAILTHHLFAFQFESLLADLGVPVIQVVLNGHRLPFAEHALFISEFVKGMPGMEARSSDQVMIPPAFDDVIADTHGEAIGFIKPIPHKGVHLVYEIAAAMPDREFVVLRGEWQTLEVLTDLPNVRYMEPVDDIRDFYREVCMVLVPSVSEDAGTVAQECALNGLPCLSSMVGGLAETNRHGVRINGGVDQWVMTIRAAEERYVELAERARAGARYNNLMRDQVLDLFAHRVVACMRKGT